MKVFLRFAKFYQTFTSDLNRISTWLTSILKTIVTNSAKIFLKISRNFKFLITKAKGIFISLNLTFTETLILYHFYWKPYKIMKIGSLCYITNVIFG